MRRTYPQLAGWLIAGLLCSAGGTPAARAQDFALCTVVDAKHRTLTLGWTKPPVPVSGYSFVYNGYEITPYRPTIEDPERTTYSEKVGFGRHIFQLKGFDSDLATNEVEVEVRMPHYYTILVPGLYQALYRRRYASTCQRDRWGFRDAFALVKPAVLLAGAGYSALLWVRFFDHKNAALNARTAYLNSLRTGELERWRTKRDKAREIYNVAVTASIATLAANLITAVFMSPHGRVRVRGGFSMDCSSHPDRVNLCVKL